MEMDMQPLTIGQVAKQAGVGVETIRFYERLASKCKGCRPTSECPILEELDRGPQ
jgi:hypothetical protein